MSLARHLDRQKNALAALIDLLLLEQKSLTQSEFDGQQLITLAEQKKGLLAQIETLESQRTKGQINLGYGEGIDGARKAAQVGDCEPLWDDLLELASQAKHLNGMNSSIIKMRMEQTQKMVSFLHEASGGVMYGRDGKSRNKKIGGVSAKA